MGLSSQLSAASSLLDRETHLTAASIEMPDAVSASCAGAAYQAPVLALAEG
jgi:hypothetical protein